MEAKYIPKLDNEKPDTIILDTIFKSKDCMRYATDHNFNVRFTDTTSTSAVEVIMDFINAGYTHELYEVPVTDPDGNQMRPRVECLFRQF